MDELGYTAEQLIDAATDYHLAAQAGRLDEADLRASIGRQTFGATEWVEAVNRASATEWVGQAGFPGLT